MVCETVSFASGNRDESVQLCGVFWMDIGQFKKAEDCHWNWSSSKQIELVFGGGTRLLYVDVNPWSGDWCEATDGARTLHASVPHHHTVTVDTVEGGNFGGRLSAVRLYATFYHDLVNVYIQHLVFWLTSVGDECTGFGWTEPVHSSESVPVS